MLIKAGHTWNDFERTEPWINGRQKNERKCRWCESSHYGKGLCRAHFSRADRAVKKGASWNEFEHKEPTLIVRIPVVKETAPKEPRKPKQEIVDGKMQCVQCNETKPVSDYYTSKTNASGLVYCCKSCHNERCAKRQRNRFLNDEEFARKSKEYGRIWKRQNSHLARNYIKKWQKNNPEKVKAIRNKPINKVRNNIRKRLRDFIKGKVRFPGVGCSRDELIKHIEERFDFGMTWENYGEWHIDHIRPCASFNLFDHEQLKQCTHYTNLQPLWADENCRKGAKYNA
jgi:hypothetical protein